MFNHSNIRVIESGPAARAVIGGIEMRCFGWERLLCGLWMRIGRPGVRAWIADLSGVHAGYAIAYPKPLDGAAMLYLGGVGVLPAQRRRGVAKALISTALKCADGALWLHVRAGNTPAIQLYQSLGFEVCQSLRSFYETGESRDALVMRYERRR